jgi:predicted RNA-binding Zn-ribbon protein involved in translation (DUF1610 family)
VTCRDLLAGEPGEVDIGFELVTALTCPRCAASSSLLAPRARLRSEDARCPACGIERAVDWLSSVESEMAIADRPLKDLGVPPHHVVRVRGGRMRDVLLGGNLIEASRILT